MASNKTYFLDGIKNNPMTISQIVDTYGCTSNTARSWVKHEEVEKVAGSYPPEYVRKDTFVSPSVKRSDRNGVPITKLIVELEVPPEADIEAFFRRIMAAEGGTIDFQSEFRSVDSQKSLMVLQNKLKAALIVCDYYMTLMKKDGIE